MKKRSRETTEMIVQNAPPVRQMTQERISSKSQGFLTMTVSWVFTLYTVVQIPATAVTMNIMTRDELVCVRVSVTFASL